MSRLGASRYLDSEDIPVDIMTSVHQLTTHDDAKVTGVLRAPPRAKLVVTIMHPRQDTTHHALVVPLLRAGFAVWTQGSRSPNNDLTLIHEQALLDVAAGMAFLRTRFERIVHFGHSGGGTLYAFYTEQATLPPPQRLTKSPGGRPVPLAEAEMPVADGAIFLAPHPGQGELLLHCIDASVTDEADPMSLDPSLDIFAPANGFREPPTSAEYEEGFLARIRAAQRARIQRIDDIATQALAVAAEAKRAGDKRREIAPRIIQVFRTDADPRTVDLHLDPSERPYGSVFGRRPDLINYGLVGFGRLSTPEAWLSTWSGLSSNARFVRCAPGVKIPTLFIELTGDQCAFPSVSAAMVNAIGAADREHVKVRGTHFGGPIAKGEPTGAALASVEIARWLGSRSG